MSKENILEQCIFCLKTCICTKEHVFPLAIGGSLFFYRVCEFCNSTLGHRVDAALTDNFVVMARRAQLGLAGNSGTVPTALEILPSVARLAGNPDRKVRIVKDPASGMVATKTIPRESNVVMPDGTQARQIIVDERDKDIIPKIIQRNRKRLNMPPLTESEIEEEIQKYNTKTLITEENPQLTITFKLNFAFFRHAVFKIAYELAFLWLGDSYLHDPTAAELRTAICSENPSSTEGLPGYVGPLEGHNLFPYWTPSKSNHLAYSNVQNGGLVIAVRVFDLYGAIVSVSKDASRYAHLGEAKMLRFFVMNSLNGEMHDTPFHQELCRLEMEATKKGCLPPFLDPLS
jgi:hypothetical protein